MKMTKHNENCPRPFLDRDYTSGFENGEFSYKYKMLWHRYVTNL